MCSQKETNEVQLVRPTTAILKEVVDTDAIHKKKMEWIKATQDCLTLKII